MSGSRILWLSNAASFRLSVTPGEFPAPVTGGIAYNRDAYRVLADAFTMGLDPSFERGVKESVPGYAMRIAHLKADADILIKDPMVFTFHRDSGKARTIGMVHHIDYLKKYTSIRHWAYLRRLEKMMTRLDRVVVVSEYWRGYVMRRGVTDATVIHNSFDIREFAPDAAKIEEFSTKYEIPNDRPVVYLGMATAIKGFDRALRILRDEDLTLVATGEYKGQSFPNLRVLSLSRQEYLALLHRADLTVSLPAIPEGWSRVAHESLLCKTPVIGLKSGGMTELLEKAGQTIISADHELIPALQKVLARQSEFSVPGREYVSQFDMQYFKNAWINACNSLRG